MNDAMLASGPVNDTGGVRYRAAAVAVGAAEIRRAENGAWYLRSREPLGDYPTRLTDCLVNGAQAHPDRVLAAKRGDDGRWIEITYAQMLERARALGQGLVDLGLSAERPLAVLSGNDLEHLQLMFAAMLAGVPYSPISPAYSLVSTDYGKLRHTLGVLKPGAVFVAERAPFVRALDAVLPADAALIVARDDDADVDADGKGRAVPLALARHRPAHDRRDPRGGRPRSSREDPVHVRLHEAAEGRADHAPDAVQQPADAAPDDARTDARTAGAGRLAAVESHVRRQSQPRHRAIQRRHAVYRRRPPDAGPLRRNRAQPARDRADDLLQRAERLGRTDGRARTRCRCATRSSRA